MLLRKSVLLVSLFVSMGLCQEATGVIESRVLDESGAVVQGATVSGANGLRQTQANAR